MSFHSMQWVRNEAIIGIRPGPIDQTRIIRKRNCGKPPYRGTATTDRKQSTWKDSNMNLLLIIASSLT